MRPAALAAAAALLACTSCGGEPEPRLADPTPTVASPSPTPASSSAAPALGPEDTVRAWVEAQNQALQDGDATAVESLATATCSTCADIVDPIKGVFEAGGRFETTGWEVVTSRLVNEKPDTAKVRAAIVFAAGRTFTSASASPVDYDVQRRILEFRLKQEPSGWRVAFIGFL